MLSLELTEAVAVVMQLAACVNVSAVLHENYSIQLFNYPRLLKHSTVFSHKANRKAILQVLCCLLSSIAVSNINTRIRMAAL